jgi:transketolase N-terminal domain/subunit
MIKESIQDTEQLKKIASQVRRDIVRQVHACQSGHPGGSLGCTDLLVALFFNVMKHNTERQRRRFILFIQRAYFTGYIQRTGKGGLF